MNNNYLYHHGILGQRWGVRRFQNVDGSYTAAGKKKYQKPKEFMRDLDREFNKYEKQNKALGDRLDKTAKRFEKEANELLNDYDNAYKNAKMDQATKNKLMEAAYSRLGKMTLRDGDQGMFNDAIEDEAFDAVIEHVDKQLDKKRQTFDKTYDQLSKETKEYIGGIVDRYKDVEVRKGSKIIGKGDDIVRESVEKTLKNNSAAHAYYHFDEYNNPDSLYDAQYRWSTELYKEYNNWVKTHK